MKTCCFNTLTRRREPLRSQAPNRIRLYVCGPTVYDDPHLGHARSTVVFDVICRYLECMGQDVTYIRNITDIDDRIIARARDRGEDCRTLSRRYTKSWHLGMDRLNIRRPDAEPRVTETILPIQEFISKLIQQSRAYSKNGNVYFSVPSCPHYGRLSGRSSSIPPDHGNGPGHPEKRHPADFVLWKSAGTDEPSWPSPWGAGRPGWHVECAAISKYCLGEVFDMHGGGTDLIFPHHENEIALSESLSGKIPAAFWVHHGLVTAAGGKMSKSGGNAVNLHELLDVYPPDAVRLFLLSRRYRKPLAFSHEKLEAMTRQLVRLSRFFSRMGGATPRCDIPRSDLWSRFCKAMDDDFNFPLGLAAVSEAVNRLRKAVHHSGARSLCQTPRFERIYEDAVFICLHILGLKLEPEADLPAETLWKALSAEPGSSRAMAEDRLIQPN